MKTRSILTLLSVLCVAGAGTFSTAQTLDAGRGELPLTVPAGYSANSPTPLIVLLHGYGSSGAGQDSYMQFSSLADRYGFLFVAPDGNQESGGNNNRFWNASEACCNFFGGTDNDATYIKAIIDQVKAGYNVDANRIYLIGHSNGGFMSYLLANQYPETIAALVSLAGAEAGEPRPAPAAPVHILQIHGTEDGTIAYAGADIRGNRYPGAVETVERWANYNGCQMTGVEVAQLDLERELTGYDSRVMRYDEGCRTGGSGELWTIDGGSHIPALSDSFSENVVEWLYAHPKVRVDTQLTSD